MFVTTHFNILKVLLDGFLATSIEVASDTLYAYTLTLITLTQTQIMLQFLKKKKKRERERDNLGISLIGVEKGSGMRLVGASPPLAES